MDFYKRDGTASLCLFVCIHEGIDPSDIAYVAGLACNWYGSNRPTLQAAVIHPSIPSLLRSKNTLRHYFTLFLRRYSNY